MKASLDFFHHSHTWSSNTNVFQCNIILLALFYPFNNLIDFFRCITDNLVNRLFSSMDERNITANRFSTSIHIIVSLAFDNSNSYFLDRFCCTIVNLQSLTTDTTHIDTCCTKVYLATTVNTLHRITGQEQVISSFCDKSTKEFKFRIREVLELISNHIGIWTHIVII